MRLRAWALCGFLAVWGSIAAPVSASPVHTIPHQYIISRNATSVSSLSAEQIAYETVKGGEYFDVVIPDRYGVNAFSAADLGSEVLNPDTVESDCEQILRDPTVATCEPNVWVESHRVPNDTSFNLQWYLHDASQDGDIEAPRAWDESTGSSGVVIGVLDTGIYTAHPDLAPRLWTNPNETVNGIDDDSNGYVDDIHGLNTALNTSDPEDLDGHGTHVSGIIAAAGDNGTGVSGVMWQGSLVVVSAATAKNTSFPREALIEGLNYFYDLKTSGYNIRVVNCSYGSTSSSTDERAAISRLNDVGVLVVVSAGNKGHQGNPTYYPASYDLPNVISVGATGRTKELAYYSNYGDSVDIAAPGGDVNVGGAAGQIYSTYSPVDGADYAYLQGTSMAAPVVTGALGLLASKYPTLTAAELKSTLLSTADILSLNVNSGRFINLGAMLNLGAPADDCPEDPAKTAPGSCGCGVADTDSDNDGSADCADGCPTDLGKTSAGVCGCGVSDVDANNNATPDCKDPVLAGIVPVAPKLKTTKGKVTVTMEGRQGVLYLLKVTTKLGRAKAKTSYYSSSSPSYTVKSLKAKTSVSVSYSYYLSGTPVVASSYSTVKKISAK